MATKALPETMKAWLSPGVTTTLEASLKLNAAALAPKPSDLAPTELIIEVISSCLNPIDLTVAESGLISRLLLRGVPAFSPGFDYCGRVVAWHPSVAASSPELAQKGALVYGALTIPPVALYGALGQYMVTITGKTAAVPAGLAADDVAGLPTAGITAKCTLAGLQPGQSVLLNGASGGVGTFALQIAKRVKGAAHVAAICSGANAELCRGLGADQVIDYKEVDVVETLATDGRKYDLIVDIIGNLDFPLYENAHKYLKKEGEYIQIGAGMSLGSFIGLGKRMLWPQCLGGGSRKYKFLTAKVDAEAMREVIVWLKEGKIRTIVDSTYEFEDVPEAFARLRSKRAKGKIIVHVQGGKRHG